MTARARGRKFTVAAMAAALVLVVVVAFFVRRPTDGPVAEDPGLRSSQSAPRKLVAPESFEHARSSGRERSIALLEAAIARTQHASSPDEKALRRLRQLLVVAQSRRVEANLD